MAYQAVILTLPTDEMLSIRSIVGIKLTLEILLIMQQVPSTVTLQLRTRLGWLVPGRQQSKLP